MPPTSNVVVARGRGIFEQCVLLFVKAKLFFDSDAVNAVADSSPSLVARSLASASLWRSAASSRPRARRHGEILRGHIFVNTLPAALRGGLDALPLLFDELRVCL